MQRTSITLPSALVEELMAEINAKNKTEAVTMAVKDEIKARKREKIIRMAGNMEFTSDTADMRHKDRRLG